MAAAEFATYETVKLGVKKGYNSPVSSNNFYWDEAGRNIHPYNWYTPFNFIHVIHAPTQTVLQRWIRCVLNIHVEIYSNASGWGWILTKINGTGIKEITDDIFFDTYEEALEAGMVKALQHKKKFKS
jgi:hypothetical protein